MLHGSAKLADFRLTIRPGQGGWNFGFREIRKTNNLMVHFRSHGEKKVAQHIKREIGWRRQPSCYLRGVLIQPPGKLFFRNVSPLGLLGEEGRQRREDAVFLALPVIGDIAPRWPLGLI